MYLNQRFDACFYQATRVWYHLQIRFVYIHVKNTPPVDEAFEILVLRQSFSLILWPQIEKITLKGLFVKMTALRPFQAKRIRIIYF